MLCWSLVVSLERSGTPHPASSPADPAPHDPAEPPHLAGSVYAPVIADQLSQERARKTSIESLGTNIATTSAGLVAFFTGFIGLIVPKTASGVPILPMAMSYLIGAAFALFVVASLCGLFANILYNSHRSFGELNADDLVEWVDTCWRETDLVAATQTVAEKQILVLKDARVRNLRKRLFVAAGFVVEFMGAGVITGAIASYFLR